MLKRVEARLEESCGLAMVSAMVNTGAREVLALVMEAGDAQGGEGKRESSE